MSPSISIVFPGIIVRYEREDGKTEGGGEERRGRKEEGGRGVGREKLT
jgi:hypothetical protein